jgi:hypothetical protein
MYSSVYSKQSDLKQTEVITATGVDVQYEQYLWHGSIFKGFK